MHEVYGNFWDWKPPHQEVDCRCITTNGAINSMGELVMGRGVAYQAKSKYKTLPFLLGNHVKHMGNHVHPFSVNDSGQLATFPVKHHWKEKADLGLIDRSSLELEDWANKLGWLVVVIPRPGCGNGQLDWETQVKPIMAQLDDRFYIIDFAYSKKEQL